MWIEYIKTAGAVCASLGAFGGLVVGLWWFVRKVVKIADAVEQLNPNGGKSLFDRVDAIHAIVVDVVERVTALEKKKR